MNNGSNANLFSDPLGDGSAFERGSRHPRWRGGVDKLTLKNRQKTYRTYGIGFTVSSNSSTDILSDSLQNNPVVDFIAERTNELIINRLETVQHVNQLIQIILSYDGLLFDENKPQSSRLLTVKRLQYQLTLRQLNAQFGLTIHRTGVVARPRHKITLLEQIRQDTKVKKESQLFKQNQKKLNKHVNQIKGFENLR